MSNGDAWLEWRLDPRSGTSLIGGSRHPEFKGGEIVRIRDGGSSFLECVQPPATGALATIIFATAIYSGIPMLTL